MTRHHVIRTRLFALGLATLATSPAFAQKTTADDVAYCNQLSGMYNRYPGDATPSTETMTAEANCTIERAVQAIPQLEKLLLAKGFRLPEKAAGHQP